MIRIGEINPSLARFRRYRDHAKDLERRKSRTPSSPAQRSRWSAIDEEHEAVLDAAWREVKVIADWYGGFAAELVSRHFLLLEDWHDIASDMGLTHDRAKKAAYRALVWLQMWKDARLPPYNDWDHR